MNHMTPLMMLLLSSCTLHKMEAPHQAERPSESNEDYEVEEDLVFESEPSGKAPKTKKYKREIERIEHRIQPKKSLNHWNQIQKVKTLLEQEMIEAAKIQRSQIPERFNQEPDVIWIDEQLNNLSSLSEVE